MSILEWFWPKPLPWAVLLKETYENSDGSRTSYLQFEKAFEREGRWFVESRGNVIELLKGGATEGAGSRKMTWENIDHRSMGI